MNICSAQRNNCTPHVYGVSPIHPHQTRSTILMLTRCAIIEIPCIHCWDRWVLTAYCETSWPTWLSSAESPLRVATMSRPFPTAFNSKHAILLVHSDTHKTCTLGRSAVTIRVSNPNPHHTRTLTRKKNENEARASHGLIDV